LGCRIKKWPRRSGTLPEARTTKGMNFMATTSVPKAERLRTVRALTLKEAIDRFNHELLDDEERLMLLEPIKRLRRTLS
jgi:hypothetical protein